MGTIIPMRHTAPLLIAIALCISSCVSFSGGGVSPLFEARFRESSSFPQLEPLNNVLLIDVSSVVDRLDTPATLKVSIDGTQVYTQTVTSSGRIELTFPPAAWTPS